MGHPSAGGTPTPVPSAPSPFWRLDSRRVFDHDRLGDAVVDAAAVGVEEVLEKAESALQHGGAVAEGALDGLPEGDPVMHQRDDADAQQALAGRESVGLPDNEAKVQNQP